MDLAGWNARFGTEDYVFGTKPNAFLKKQSALLRPRLRALAIADGEGRNGVWLAAQGLEVVSVDFSPVAVAKAKRLAASRGVVLDAVQADIAAWAWEPQRFDVVVAIFAQFAAPALRTAMFEGIRRTLSPGGLFLLQGYRREQHAYGTGGPSEIENLYTAAMLRESFAELEILQLHEHDSVIDEGRFNRGPSALIDMIARKRPPERVRDEPRMPPNAEQEDFPPEC